MKKVAVFILLGQSNAVGHNIPMKEEDKIITPLKNVFGLTRKLNQEWFNDELFWTGYTSHDTNLGEEQDHTYSVANCLAKLWQNEIDAGVNLPDLYIVHIAIGAQGVLKPFMWDPYREMRLVPGKLRRADISLYPFTIHILNMLKDSFNKLNVEPDFFGLHWRGGESDAEISEDILKEKLKNTYSVMFDGFYNAIGEKVPTVFHKIVSYESSTKEEYIKNTEFINNVFYEFEKENEFMSVFDVYDAPHYAPCEVGKGLFIEDCLHYNSKTNKWVASEILKEYKNR